MNRLRGRMLRLPPPRGKHREILIVYGQQASLEALFPLAQELNKYGGVTIPDLPGFGGMQSFYRLGDKPTVDNLADYLAAFIKLFYKRRRLTIYGLSFGFAVVTRMLQKYPQLAKKVDLLVSESGFTRYDDFRVKGPNRAVMKLSSGLLSRRLPAALAQQILIRPFFVRTSYALVRPNKGRRGPRSKQLERHINQTIELWRQNDLRTHMSTSLASLRLDICKQQVALPVYHIATTDKYFDNDVVEQHLNVVYESVQMLEPDKPKRRSRHANRSRTAQIPHSLQLLLFQTT